MNIVRELMAGLQIGQILPNTRFFSPTKKFIDWMVANYLGRLIIEAGAGDGYTAMRLQQRGLLVEAIDLSLRDKMYFPIILANSVTHRYQPDSVVLICRPCHGVFTSETIAYALDCGVREFLYVGLDKNFVDDTDPFDDFFHPVVMNAGKDHETVYRMKGKRRVNKRRSDARRSAS